MTVPTLFARIAVHHRLDARRRLAAFCEAFAAARGNPECVQQTHQGLAAAAGDVGGAVGGGGLEGLMRALGSGA